MSLQRNRRFVQKPGETQPTFTVNAESDALLISFHIHVILRNCMFSAQTFSLSENRQVVMLKRL